MGPIGIFDSGYGGLTVLEDIRNELPQYDYLYLGDNARAPYGPRSFDVIYEYTLQAVEELFDRGCKLIILACNTASAKALRTIQQKDLQRIAPDKRVLGVIRPSAEIIGKLTESKKIGILATKGTVESNSYVLEINKLWPGLTVYQHACPLWVPLIESSEHHTKEGKAFIHNDVKVLLKMSQEIDTIILGCTHYPIILDQIKSVVPDHIKIIAQGKIVAKSLVKYLENHPEIEKKCSKKGKIHYLTTENADTFNVNASSFIDMEVRAEHINLHLKNH